MEVAGFNLDFLLQQVFTEYGAVCGLLVLTNGIFLWMYLQQRAEKLLEREDRRAAWKARNTDLENFVKILYDLKGVLEIIKDRVQR